MPSEQNPFGFGETHEQTIELPPLPNLTPTYRYVDEEVDNKEGNSNGGDVAVSSADESRDETGSNKEQVSEISSDGTAPVPPSIPDWVGEAWVPPVDAPTDWYKEKYIEALAYPSSPEFQEQLLANMKDSIIAAQEDAERIADTARALLNGDTRYLRQFFPEKLQEIGIEPVLTQEEMGTLIKQQLATEFGEDYESVFDSKHLLDPTSASAKIFIRNQQLLAHYTNENAQRKDNFERYKQGQLEIAKQNEVPTVTPDDMYERVKDKMDRKTFDETLELAKQQEANWTIADVRKIITYDNDIKEAYERGRAEALGQVRTAGNSKQIVPPTKEENKYEDFRSIPSFNKMLGNSYRQQ